MKRIAIAIGIVLCVAAAGTARAEGQAAGDSHGYTSAQIKKLARQAHTVEQYTVLANFYAAQQRMYRQKAVEQMHLWRERAEMPTPLSEKWPRPVDSARNLHDYYEYKAAQAAALFAKYDRLVDEADTK